MLAATRPERPAGWVKRQENPVLADRIEAPWIAAFEDCFRRCAASEGLPVCIFSETQSRALNLHLAELALLRLGCRPYHVQVPTPAQTAPVPVRSTGASRAIGGHPGVLGAGAVAGQRAI